MSKPKMKTRRKHDVLAREVETTYSFLILGAIMKMQVEIEYEYLDVRGSKRFGCIQPIKWLEDGRKGRHILTWDVEANNWRRFAVANIKRVTLTDRPWEKEMKTELAG